MFPDRPGGAIWELTPVEALMRIVPLIVRSFSRFMPLRDIGFRVRTAMTNIFGRTNPMEALMPTFPLAMMVAIIEILVITLAGFVSGPMGILPLEILPVNRVALIPRMPLRRIPVVRPDNIGGRIGVIRGPAILSAEKIMQYSI